MIALLLRLFRLLPPAAVKSIILRGNLLRHAVTLGVRVVVEDEAGRVLLVRHSYVPGWYFPGGAVDLGESAEAAAIRELREETGLQARERPELFGLYRQTAAAGRDHVAVFRLRRFAEGPDGHHDPEIAKLGWFARAAIPDDATAATRARLAELFNGAPRSETW